MLKKYPARLSVTAFTCFFGLIQFLIIAGIAETNIEKWKVQSGDELITILYAVTSWLKLNLIVNLELAHG